MLTRVPLGKPIGRRSFLRAGVLGLAGLGLADFFRREARAERLTGSAERTSCILVWLAGGPSHMDTYDLKPEAPAEYRGLYRPIRTCVPGMEVCELLPRHGQLAHRFTLIRSCSHDFAGHWDGAQHVLTGYPAVLSGGGTQTSVYPEVGTIIKKVRPRGPGGLPDYVAVVNRLENVGPAYLGRSYEPFVARGDPNDPAFQVPNLSLPVEDMSRLAVRRSLRRAFDCMRRDLDSSGVMQAMDSHDREAMHLLTSRETEQAFDLSREDRRVRECYGRCTAGQALVLTRRLVEAGVGFVTVELSGYREFGVDGGWDDHAGVCDIFDRMNRRLPVYDRALTALIEDIYQRGLDRNVMVLVMGEFGRTPQINVRDGKPGREHWPGAMSVLVSGGGMRMGQVIGATDARGERPRNRPLHPPDLLATVYHYLDIDPRLEFRDHGGRPRPILSEGQPIRELL